MPDLVCDTSPIQYLHQLGLLHLLRKLGGKTCVPAAVVEELDMGRRSGVDLPVVEDLAWISVVHPRGEKDTRLVGDMGTGEAEVLMLVLETDGLVAVLDDGVARRRADLLGIPFTGTLGILLDAKKRGLISEVLPFLDKLEALRFRLAVQTRELILNRAGER